MTRYNVTAACEVEIKIHSFHPCHCVELSDWSYVLISLSTGTKAMELIKFAGLSAAKLVRT